MSPHYGAADRLNDHLDAVVAGETTRPHDLDPALTATVERFFAIDDAPGPPADLADQLWDDLLQRAAPLGRNSPGPALWMDLNAHTLAASTPASLAGRGLSRTRLITAQLATAALILLVLVGSVVALRGAFRQMGQEERPIVFPAIEGSPESTTLVEALVTTWPTGGPPFFVSIERITLDPGAVEAASTDATGMGPDLFTIESGQVAVTADGPVIVARGPNDRQAESATVPARTTIVLDEGDQFFAPAEVSFRRRNDTADAASILDYQISDVEPAHHAKDMTYQKVMPDKVLNAAPPTPAQVALRRLRLLPGSILLISDLPGLQMLYVEDGTLELLGDDRAPGDLLPVSGMSISAGNGTSFLTTTHALANRGADPVTILIATIDPAQ